MPFLIVGMPRSRTAWLANLLTWGDTFCAHAGLSEHKTVEKLMTWLKEPGTLRGDADPILTLVPDAIIENSIDFKMVYVVRGLQDVWASSLKAYAGQNQNTEALVTASEIGFRMLRKYAPGMEIPYESLDDEASVRKLWGHLIPSTPFPVERFRMLSLLNIQEDFAKAAKLKGAS